MTRPGGMGDVLAVVEVLRDLSPADRDAVISAVQAWRGQVEPGPRPAPVPCHRCGDEDCDGGEGCRYGGSSVPKVD